jgi:hypothetical protein
LQPRATGCHLPPSRPPSFTPAATPCPALPRRTDCIPPALLQDYQKLLGSAPTRRLNPSKVAESKFLNNTLVGLVAFMENIAGARRRAPLLLLLLLRRCVSPHLSATAAGPMLPFPAQRCP